jgi:hypothetical protein
MHKANTVNDKSHINVKPPNKAVQGVHFLEDKVSKPPQITHHGSTVPLTEGTVAYT